MKKLLFVLLCVPLITLFNSCSSGGGAPTPNNIPTLQSTIVDQIWELKTEEYRFNLHNNGELYEKDLICDEFSLTGWWSLDNDELTLTRQEGPLEISETITVTSFSANEIKFNIFSDSTTIIEEVYISVEPVIRGCMDSNSVNYNPDAVCNTNCSKTYVPDDAFEQKLIYFGYDDVLDDSVITANINTVTFLDLRTWGEPNITDLTGIEDFTALISLNCYANDLTSLDVSNNTALTYLNCKDNYITNLDVSDLPYLEYLNIHGNTLTTLDLSNNTALTYLNCYGNYLTSLDVSYNTLIDSLDCEANQLTILDLSNNTPLTYLNCSRNQLTSLDLSENYFLTTLYCYTNQLTSLQIHIGEDYFTGVTNEYLDCRYNANLFCINVIGNTNAVSLAYSIPHLSLDQQQYFSVTCP